MANTLKIYTRTGDKGETSLYGGKRVLKSSERVDTYGTIDELNSTLGLVVAHLRDTDEELEWLTKELQAIQSDLFTIGALLANPGHIMTEKEKEYFRGVVVSFEKHIDAMTKKLPLLRNFILPGGSVTGSYLHTARTICRRAERRLVQLNEHETADPTIVKYLNRLSDLLFTMARYVNAFFEEPEIVWHKRNG